MDGSIYSSRLFGFLRGIAAKEKGGISDTQGSRSRRHAARCVATRAGTGAPRMEALLGGDLYRGEAARLGAAAADVSRIRSF